MRYNSQKYFQKRCQFKNTCSNLETCCRKPKKNENKKQKHSANTEMMQNQKHTNPENNRIHVQSTQRKFSSVVLLYCFCTCSVFAVNVLAFCSMFFNLQHFCLFFSCNCSVFLLMKMIWVVVACVCLLSTN